MSRSSAIRVGVRKLTPTYDGPALLRRSGPSYSLGRLLQSDAHQSPAEKLNEQTSVYVRMRPGRHLSVLGDCTAESGSVKGEPLTRSDQARRPARFRFRIRHLADTSQTSPASAERHQRMGGVRRHEGGEQ